MAECYEIRLRGRAGDLTAAAFADMDVSSERRTTVLRGMIDDQAALHGILHRCRDLGMEIVEVRVVGTPVDRFGPGDPVRAAAEPARRPSRWPQLVLVVAAVFVAGAMVALAGTGSNDIVIATLAVALVLLGVVAWRTAWRGERYG